jgi:hypothetical protein
MLRQQANTGRVPITGRNVQHVLSVQLLVVCAAGCTLGAAGDRARVLVLGTSTGSAGANLDVACWHVNW